MPMRVSAPGNVPDSFAPSVSQGDMPMVPATAPWVSPMKNAAPGLLQQTGQTLMEAGSAAARLGNTIGDRVQETMDDGMTKAAENQFLQSAMPVFAQYKTTEGINAAKLFDPAAQTIVKAREDARASLNNPIQQRMFDMATNDHMLTFQEQMSAHKFGQQVQYGKDQAKARAQSLNTMSTLDVAGRNREDSQFALRGKEADAEMLHYAGLSGIAPDSPQAEDMLRQNRTERYTSVVDALMAKDAYYEASDFLDAHRADMDPKQVERLEDSVKRAARTVQGTQTADQTIQSLQKTTGAGPLSFPLPAGTISTTQGVDGIDIHAAPGTSVYAPASGTVTKVWADEEHGLSAQVTLPSGYTATLSGLGAVNYKEGQKITAGQVLALSGKDDNGRAVTHYAMMSPDGTAVGDPRQAASAPFDPKNFSSPEDEAEAVSRINASESDDLVRRVAVNRIESLANHNREILNQQHADAVKQAMNYAVQNGGSIAGLPWDVQKQLTPVDVDNFNQEAKAKNDVGLMANWIEHPEQQTVNAVTLAHQQGRLSDNGYLTALRQAVALQGKDANSTEPQKVLGVSVDNEQIENTLTYNGHQDIAGAKPAEPDKMGRPLTAQQQTANQLVAQRVGLQSEIKDRIDAEQQVTKQPMTRNRKQEIIDDVILHSSFLAAPGWTGGLAPWQVTPEVQGAAKYTSSSGTTRPYTPMPPVYRPDAIRSLIQRRQPVTEQTIYDTWVNAGMPGASGKRN